MWEMPKHKKNKKSKRLSSSTSGEDEKVTGGQCLISKDKNAKRKESCDIHDRQQQKEYPLPSSKDDSKSHRRFKKAAYKLSKTPCPDQKRPVENEVGGNRTKTVDIPSWEKTSPGLESKSSLSRKSPFIPVGPTVQSGPFLPRSIHSKDTRRQTAERTEKHDPHIKSCQKDSSKSVRPAEHNYKPPVSKTAPIPQEARKRKADTTRVTPTKQSTTISSSSISSSSISSSISSSSISSSSIPSSSLKKSKAQGGWKPLSKPHEDERGDPPAGKSSISAPWQRTTKQTSSASTTPAASECKPKLPTLAKRLYPAPGSLGGSLTPSRPAVKFTIPKKIRPTFSNDHQDDDTNDYKNNTGHNERGAVSTRTTSRVPPSEPVDSKGVDPKETGPVQGVCSTAVDPSPSSPRGHDGSLTVSHRPIWQCTNNSPSCQEVAEVLLRAPGQSRLQVWCDVVPSYGELTQMDTDDGETDTFEHNCIVVLDTNILLSHLDYVKKIRSHGLGGMGFAMLLVPWVVLQELDAQKNTNRPEGSVAHLATPAIHFIYSCLKSLEPRLWGQSMQQASEGNRHLNAENNDDRILQCCLQYQILCPESALILCTNDKNLCSKALLSGVKALCKAELEEESRRLHNPALPTPTPTPTLTPLPRHLHTHTQQPSRGNRGSSLGHRAPEQKQAPTKAPTCDGGEEAVAQRRRVSQCVQLLENCLKEALSHILEVEMKAAYDDLWEDIVFVKQPWELLDVLKCIKKHWIAVFGDIFPRNRLHTVVTLLKFFTPGEAVEQASVLAALREAEELLEVFGKTKEMYGGRVSTTLDSLATIERQLLAQPEHVPAQPLVGDAVMSDHEEKQAPPHQVSHQDVWALFENIWDNVCQMSSAVFAALHFDPGTMRRTGPEGSLPPPLPEDALACLHKLLPMVIELLQGFSRVLSSDMGMEESQALLSFIHASQIVSINTHLSTNDFVVCFSQHEYREKLRVGGAQLTELKVTLEQCSTAVSQSLADATW